MNTHDKYELPPLPESRIVSYQIDSTMRRMELRTYSDEDMRDYARAAIESDRIQQEDYINDDRDQLRAEIVALKGTIADLEADRQARGEPVESDAEDLIERLLDAQQDINLAANEHMSQLLCDASALIDEIVQVLHRLSTRPQQIPDGWQLVPKEPTEAMKNASLKACDGKAYPADMRIGPMAMNADVYKAMLAAAPQPDAKP